MTDDKLMLTFQFFFEYASNTWEHLMILPKNDLWALSIYWVKDEDLKILT